jgi:PAS domain S-box-containing protein
MPLSSLLPQSAAGRRLLPLLAGYAVAVAFAGTLAGAAVRQGRITSADAVLATAGAALAAGLAALGWALQYVERQHRRLKVSEASLQSQISARARELETATSSLRIATKVNALLALCAQHMPSAAIITDAAGTILWANTAWEKLSGWTLARSARRPLEIVLAQVWEGFRAEEARSLLQAGAPAQIDMQVADRDGGARWLSIAFQPVRNEAQDVVNTIVLVDDVTARRQADLRIQAANERLQFALLSSGYGIWEISLAEGRVEWDERMYELYGTERSAFGGNLAAWDELIHPDDLEHVRAHRQQVIDGALKTFALDFRILRPDGAVRYIEAHGFMHREADQRRARFIGLNRDITAEREMRETLRLAEERLELALLATSESVWDWNFAAGKIYRDRRWTDLTGEDPTTRLEDDHDWTSRIHPEDLPRVQAALSAHRAGRTPVYWSEHRLRTKGGKWIWTLDRGRVVSRDKDGRALRMVGTQGDITDRKQLEARLHHSEEISIQVSRLAQIGAWEYDISTSVLRWEPELFRITGVELGYEPTLDSMCRFVPGGEGEIFREAVELAIREGRSFDLECPFVTAQGRRRWARLFGRAEFSEGRPVRVFGAVQDVTVRHEAEEAQRKLEGQLFQVQKMETLGTLAGGIAHDFNNLLTGIIGYQDLAIDGLPEDNPARPCLAEARSACVRACELVDQILVFSRQTAGSERSASDLGTIIEEARRFLRATVPATVRIEVSVQPGLPWVHADPSQLSQVLLNLGSNAAYAMRSGNGVLSIAVATAELNATQAARHGNLPAGRYVSLTISDTGHGMDAETQKRIFDPFFTTKNVGEGTGLGLSIVHGIVRSHGGAIEVESSPGRGTTFRIYLPAAVDEAAPAETPAEPPPRGDGEMICVVDDEQLVAQATRLTLERFGYRTVVFRSGDECLEALRRGPEGCALLLSDQTMPGLTGMELAAKVREFAPRLPVIIMSGYFSKVSAPALEQLGRISLLAKPFVAAELARAVREALVAASQESALTA